MIVGQSSCSIQSGAAGSLAASGEPRSPSRTSRTVQREHPSARAISRSPRPSPSRLRISSYRPTVMLREPIQPSPPSWAISVAVGLGDTAQSPTKGGFSSGMDIGGAPPQRPPRRGQTGPPPGGAPPGARQTAAPAGGPQLRKSGGPELRKSGGPQPRKSPGSELRKLSTSRAKAAIVSPSMPALPLFSQT